MVITVKMLGNITLGDVTTLILFLARKNVSLRNANPLIYRTFCMILNVKKLQIL